MKSSEQTLPIADANGAYWWFRPNESFCIFTEPQCVYVRWMRGAVRALFGGKLYRVTEMQGDWYGPISLPPGW